MSKDKSSMEIDAQAVTSAIDRLLPEIPPHTRRQLMDGEKIWCLNFVQGSIEVEPGLYDYQYVEGVFGAEAIEEIEKKKQAPVMLVLRSPDGQHLQNYLIGVFSLADAPN